jgi:hypothetical protein
MTDKKNPRYFRALRKTYQPWRPPAPGSLKTTDDSSSASKRGADDVEWTAEEWDRIWRSASE